MLLTGFHQLTRGWTTRRLLLAPLLVRAGLLLSGPPAEPGSRRSYNTSLSATAVATTALFGTPNQNTGTAHVSRQAQLGFKVQF